MIGSINQVKDISKSRNHIEKKICPCIPTDGEPSDRLLFGFHSIIALSGPPIKPTVWPRTI